MARKGLTLTLGLVFGLVVVPMLLPMRYGIGPFAAALVAVVVGALLTPTRRAETLLVGMGLGMFVVLCGDQLLGTNLELDTPLGSSSVAALRFYGMGNDLMAFTLASCLLFVPRLLKNRRPPGARELGLLGALFLLTTLLLGAPTFGANVGGTLTVGATLALALVLLARGRIGWEGWVGAFAAASVLLGACILLDLHRPLSVQTHLARNISYVQEGGLHQVWRVVVEKAQLNRRMLTFSPIAPLFIPIFLAMFYAVLRPARAFRPLFSEKPHFYSCLKAAMIGSVIGALTKDSGIIIAMLIFSLLAPATFLLALSPRSEKTAGSN